MRGIYRTYQGWRKALRESFPGFRIEGDRDIAQAFDATGRPCGEWDGDRGEVSAVQICTFCERVARVDIVGALPELPGPCVLIGDRLPCCRACADEHLGEVSADEELFLAAILEAPLPIVPRRLRGGELEARLQRVRDLLRG